MVHYLNAFFVFDDNCIIQRKDDLNIKLLESEKRLPSNPALDEMLTELFPNRELIIGSSLDKIYDTHDNNFKYNHAIRNYITDNGLLIIDGMNNSKSSISSYNNILSYFRLICNNRSKEEFLNLSKEMALIARKYDSFQYKDVNIGCLNQ